MKYTLARLPLKVLERVFCPVMTHNNPYIALDTPLHLGYSRL
jgi:hypothetical protein